jgi:hypothetical protein
LRERALSTPSLPFASLTPPPLPPVVPSNTDTTFAAVKMATMQHLKTLLTWTLSREHFKDSLTRTLSMLWLALVSIAAAMGADEEPPERSAGANSAALFHEFVALNKQLLREARDEAAQAREVHARRVEALEDQVKTLEARLFDKDAAIVEVVKGQEVERAACEARIVELSAAAAPQCPPHPPQECPPPTAPPPAPPPSFLSANDTTRPEPATKTATHGRPVYSAARLAALRFDLSGLCGDGEGTRRGPFSTTASTPI